MQSKGLSRAFSNTTVQGNSGKSLGRQGGRGSLTSTHKEPPQINLRDLRAEGGALAWEPCDLNFRLVAGPGGNKLLFTILIPSNAGAPGACVPPSSLSRQPHFTCKQELDSIPSALLPALFPGDRRALSHLPCVPWRHLPGRTSCP